MSPKQFKAVRTRLRLTQDELAQIIGVSGKGPISHFETGFRTPSLLTQAVLGVLDGLTEVDAADLIARLKVQMRKLRRQATERADG